MPRLSDLTLDQSTTYSDVVGRWGNPETYGPGDSIRRYSLDSNEQLWLTFSSPDAGSLTRAIVIGVGPMPKPRIVFDIHPLTQKRRCDHLDFRKAVSAADVNAAWGPPDNVIGSGIDNWMYLLADGAAATLIFSGGKVVNVTGCGR